MKRTITNAAATAVLFCAWAAGAAPEIRLASDGKPLQAVVVSESASESIRASARTLAEQLGRISHASFAITNGLGSFGIAVGTAKNFPELTLETELSAPDPARREQYLLRSHTHGLYVVGVSELAVQQAVWDLLYRLGYRHFFPGQHWEIVPDSKDLRIAIDANEKPDFYHRRIWYGFGPWETAKEPYRLWTLHNRMGGGFELNSGHSYEGIIKAKKAEFDAHPEYLALVEGKRKGAKFCISNPDLRKLVVQYELEKVAERPDLDSVSLEPSDGGGWCECDACKKMGSVTDRVVTLANDVAQAFEEKKLNTYVCIYAYSFHAPPPKVKPHPRVIVSVATSYRPPGYTTERLVDEWGAAGTKQFGIREYYSVFWWDRSLPGGGNGASTTYITNSLATFHAKGARYLSAESSDAWGSHGLGYYLASRLMWNVDDVNRASAILDDFLTKSFGDAREPMRKFYELIDGANKPRMSDHLIGTMYRLLKEAGGKTKDPAVRARLDDLILYTRYVDLFQRFEARKPKSDERQKAWEELLRFAYRARGTMMMDVQVLYRNFWFRYGGGVTVPEEAGFKVPEPKNPWKSSEPFTRAEIDAFLTEGIDRRPTVEIKPVAFSHELVPVTPLQPPRVESVVSIGRTRGLARYFTWFDTAPATLKLTARSGLLNHKIRPADSEVRLIRVKGEERETVDRAAVPSDKEPHAIELKAKHAGLHEIEVYAPGTGASIDWEPGTIVTLEASKEYLVNFTGDWTMYFYVPKGTREVGGYAYGQRGRSKGTLRDGDGNVVMPFTVEARYFKVAVPEGQDGRFWRFDTWSGRVFLLTVPPWLARSPQELLVPREVVETDVPDLGRK